MATDVGCAQVLGERLRQKTALIGVIGLGYVGLPICIAAGESGSKVLGFDVDPAKPEALAQGKSYLKHIPDERIAPLIASGHLTATTDFNRLSELQPHCRSRVGERIPAHRETRVAQFQNAWRQRPKTQVRIPPP